jgi:MFS family permease
MTVYSLWTNWTTLFLTTEHGLPVAEANKLAPWPHFFAYFGAVAAGALSYRFIARGMEPLAARRRALLISALAILTTALVPFMPTPVMAIAMISVSFFLASGWGVNFYTMPVDAYGHNAAFAVSLLTMAYGILQIFLSPLIGRTIDEFGFRPVCLGASVMPLAGLGVVYLTRKRT